jgi:hypothetical protein
MQWAASQLSVRLSVTFLSGSRPGGKYNKTRHFRRRQALFLKGKRGLDPSYSSRPVDCADLSWTGPKRPPS